MAPFYKTLLFTLLLPGTVTVLLPALLLSAEAGRTRSWLNVFGLPLIAAGVAIYLHCAWHFAFTGQGTPAPIDPPKELVVRGLYRYMRNPMYVGVLGVLFGEALWFASMSLFGYAALVWLLFQLFITGYEEPHLQRQFGATYQRYCQTVPRWLGLLRHP
jgi:protein-S-isoprenylcysteine O-methyltransferase Ste14